MKRKTNPHIQRFKEIRKVRRWKKYGHPYSDDFYVHPRGYLVLKPRDSKVGVQDYGPSIIERCIGHMKNYFSQFTGLSHQALFGKTK